MNEKTISLALWEINLVLTALAKLPYDEAAATIQRIKAQVERPENCHCCPAAKGCRSWYGGTACAYKITTG